MAGVHKEERSYNSMRFSGSLWPSKPHILKGLVSDVKQSRLVLQMLNMQYRRRHPSL